MREKPVAPVETAAQPEVAPAETKDFQATYPRTPGHLPLPGGNVITFNGREYKIAPTMRKKVWLVIRRDRFWVVEDDPLKNRCQWPAKLGSYKS